MSRKNPTGPMCPECNGHEIRWRSKFENFLCRRCGAVFGRSAGRPMRKLQENNLKKKWRE